MTANVIDVPKTAEAAASSRSIGIVLLPKEGAIWLLIAGVMFVAGLFKGINLLVLLAYLLLGLWFLNWLMIRRFSKHLRGQRLPHEPIVVGSPVEIQLQVETIGKNSPRGVSIEDRGAEHAHGWLILRLEMPTRLRFQHVFHKRGRYLAAGLQARSRFPFGLVNCTVDLTGPEEWIVLPRLGRLHLERLKQWLQRASRGDGRIRRRQVQPALQQAEIHGLREFRAGDSPRWIHWRSSARRNQVLVCEFEDNAAPDLMLVVEPWLPVDSSPGERERLEKLITMAATLCREWCRDLLARLTMVIVGREIVFLPAGGGLEFALKALEALAVQEGDSAAAETPWLDRLRTLKSSTAVLVLTSRPSSPLGAEIASCLGRAAAQIVSGQDVPWFSPPLEGEALPCN